MYDKYIKSGSIDLTAYHLRHEKIIANKSEIEYTYMGKLFILWVFCW